MKSDLHQKYAIPETSMVKRLDENECKHKTSGDMKSPVHCVKCGYIPSITINPPIPVVERVGGRVNFVQYWQNL